MPRASDVIKSIGASQLPDEPEFAEDISEEEIEVETPIDPYAEETYAEDAEGVVEEADHFANLADAIPDGDLEAIASDLLDMYAKDEESRKDWEDIQNDAIDLLGFKITDRSEPFEGACGASHPLLAQAVIKLQAKALKELFPAAGPVRTKIVGQHNTEKLRAATRVRDYMNYQTTTVMTEYGPELDRLLFHTALGGTAFKKTYWDAGKARPCSILVTAQDFVIDYYARDLESAERYTHKYMISANDLKRSQIAGEFRDIELEEPSTVETSSTEIKVTELEGRTAPSNKQFPYTLLEIHTELDLPGYEDESGLKLPYIVTIEKDSEKILSIKRNWREEDPLKKKIVWFTPYILIPGLGFYGYGFLHLIGGLAKTATSSLQQLVDAGTFSNFPGGFKAHGLRILGPDEPLSPGEWRDVNTAASDLRNSLLPLPYKEPSPTLLKLLDFVVATAKEFADNTDQVIADSAGYGPVGTTLALLEQSGKLFHAIHARLHRSQAQDLRLLAQINFDYLPDQHMYNAVTGESIVYREDFDAKAVSVIPVSDPNMPTEAHRITKLNAIMDIARQDPAAHNMQLIRLDLYTALGVEGAERYFAQQEQPFNGDPITENATMILGKAVAAAPVDQHDAHIALHTSLLQDPMYRQNQTVIQQIQSHLAQHFALKYKLDIAKQVAQTNPQLAEAIASGQPMPGLDEKAVMEVLAASQAIAEMNKELADQFKENDDAYVEVEKMKLVADLQKHEDNIKLKREQMALQESEIMIEDANTDLDREAGIEKARIMAQARKERYGTGRPNTKNPPRN